MIRLVLLLGCLAADLFGQRLPSVNGNDVWVTKSIKWKKAPRDYNASLSTGSATVLYFRSDGQFGMMHCRLNKGPNYLVVSNGDGQVVLEGMWEARPKGIAVRYRLLTTSVPRVPPETLPGPEQTALIERASAAELRLGKEVFVAMGDRLHASELEPEFFRFRASPNQ